MLTTVTEVVKGTGTKPIQLNVEYIVANNGFLVNDAAPVPATSPSHGSYHWTFERLIAASLIPLTITPFVSGSLNPMTDAILCGAILIHSHIGFEAMVVDYFPAERVPKTRAFLWWLLRGCTVAVGVGLYEFETNDVGVTEAIKKIWTA